MTTNSLYNKSNIPPQGYQIDPHEASGSAKKDQNLQLKTLKFKKTTPQTFDCGNGTLKGSPEPYILWAIEPDPAETAVTKGGSIKAFYQDENALTLGSGNPPSNGSSDHVVNPDVGDLTAKDSNGFPFYPALFISDITSDSNNKSGDAENGGTPHKPDEVFGAWKALGGPNPQPRNFTSYPPNLGSGADTYPEKSNVVFKSGGRGHEMGYAAEIVWKVDNLGLTDGHTYRAQFILHDGDSQGDISEGCTTIQY